MTQLKTVLLAVWVALFIGVNAFAGQIETGADGRLRDDVMTMIARYEAMVGRKSLPRLISAKPIAVEDGRVVELWVIKNKKRSAPYRVKFIPLASGGVDFEVAQLSD